MWYVSGCGQYFVMREDPNQEFWAETIHSKELAHALQEGTRPGLGGTIPFPSLLLPEPPCQQKLWLAQIKHHPGETIVEVSPLLAQYGIPFVDHCHNLHMLESCSC